MRRVLESALETGGKVDAEVAVLAWLSVGGGGGAVTSVDEVGVEEVADIGAEGKASAELVIAA